MDLCAHLQSLHQIMEVKVSREMVAEDQLLISVDYMADDHQELHWRLDANANLMWDYDWQVATFTIPIADLQSITADEDIYRIRLETRDQWGGSDSTIYEFELPELPEIDEPDTTNSNEGGEEINAETMDRGDPMLVGDDNDQNNTSSAQCMSASHIQQVPIISHAWIVLMLLMISAYLNYLKAHTYSKAHTDTNESHTA